MVITPFAVAGIIASLLFSSKSFWFVVVSPSTSFLGLISSINSSLSKCSGMGIWMMMPWTFLSELRFMIDDLRISPEMSAGNFLSSTMAPMLSPNLIFWPM